MNVRSLEEKVYREEQIHSILRKLCENSGIATALTGGRVTESFRIKLGNYHDSDELLFNLLASNGRTFPPSGRDDIKVAFSMDDTRFEFRTHVIEDSIASPRMLRLKRPTVIWKIEHRNFYRVRIDNPPVPVQLSAASLPGKPVRCFTINLSEGGICCEIPAGLDIAAGEDISRISFSLPNGFEIVASGIIRWCSSTCDGNDGNTTQCGLEFGPLQRSAQVRLSDFIFMKQREEIRRKRHA